MSTNETIFHISLWSFAVITLIGVGMSLLNQSQFWAAVAAGGGAAMLILIGWDVMCEKAGWK